MWRYDAGRCASSDEALPARMNLHWVRELGAPRPAWPASQDRLQFDASYEPVVAGKTIFVGSMVSDSVTAYDTETGTEKWRFYTDGPVRFAPAAYQDKLYVVSDDGYLYGLRAHDGRLIHKFSGGPGPNKVVGNDRLIGMWPARGGPVLYDGTLYFAASIWPFMGTFIHAINAETGERVWTNSGSGSTYLMQPHSSPAFAGVAPQGYLVATEDKLLVAGGRSVPAAYDRRTGQFLYYHLNEYGKTGTCEVMASQSCFFNEGTVHNLSDGLEIAEAPASVAVGDIVISGSGRTISAYRLDPATKRPRALWQAKVPFELDKIHLKAGSHLYCSAKNPTGTVAAVGIPVGDSQSQVTWQANVNGDVWTMVAADAKLFVVTLDGRLYCFGGEERQPKQYARRTRSMDGGSERWRDRVGRLLETTGQKRGYCLLLGLGTGELLEQLLDQSQLHVVALDPDTEKVEAMRRRLDDAGHYGTRAAVHVGDITTAQLPAYMANLIVSADPDAAGLRQSDRFLERVFHSLRPYGGTACFSLAQTERTAILERAAEMNLPGCKTSTSNDLVILTRTGALPDSADWTHQYADSANTVMSRDKRVRAPLGLLWFGGPPNDKILPRHGHGPSPQVVDGRLFIEGRNMLRAVDVYTGRLLWERDFKDLGEYYDNTSHQPGANEIGSNYVSVGDGVYLVHEHTILVLDPATGKTIKEFSLPGQKNVNWGTLLICDDLLLATASPLYVPLKAKVEGQELPANAKPIIEKGADWQYLAGAHPDRTWTQADFDATDWKTGPAGFGFGDDDDKTVLGDMRNRYSVVYIRRLFNVSDPANLPEFGLAINYDDAFIAYLNGKEILRAGVGKGSGARASAVASHEAGGYEYFRIEDHKSLLNEGLNLLAIEGHNDSSGSSDFSLDPYLISPQNGQAQIQKAIARVGDVPGVEVNADYASGSTMLVVMNRQTGEVLWNRGAEYSFRHNAIAVAAGKVFCIDGLSDAKMAFLKRRGLSVEPQRNLYALDARTGRPLWRADKNVFGTWLAYSTEHGVLLEAGSRSGDRAVDEADRGMTAYRGTDGKVLWANDDSYKGPPILYHDRIITQTGGGSGSAAAEAKVYDLLTGRTVTREHPMTGQTIPWTWIRFKGCNTAIASEHLLTFRSASGAFVDLTAGQGTASIGGFKSGCTSNLIIANGVLNAPDYTRTCVCSYQNQASLALVHMPEVAYWTFDYYMLPSEPTPVRQVGINFGAPGNRTTDDGTLWLEFPSVGGPSPDVPIRAEYQDPEWFRHHNFAVEGPYNWITASGVTGLREVRVRMFIQPGRNPSSVDAFDKHIEQIPTWSDDEITGTFETPKPYTVRLYFAETEPYEAGRRVFDVSLQGRRVLENFDIVKEARGTHRTVIREFKGINIKDDLKVALARCTASQAEPLLCGMEIVAEGW